MSLSRWAVVGVSGLAAVLLAGCGGDERLVQEPSDVPSAPSVAPSAATGGVTPGGGSSDEAVPAAKAPEVEKEIDAAASEIDAEIAGLDKDLMAEAEGAAK